MNESIFVAVSERAQTAESPVWHPDEQVLYYVDIPGRELRRYDPSTSELKRWAFDSDVACCAPVFGGGMLLAMRNGIWHFDTERETKRLVMKAPYDPATERFNDGKCDASGRFWVGTIYEPRKPPNAALYCFDWDELTRKVDGITNLNGLGWSPDARTMYWSDTTSHTIFAADYNINTGELSNKRDFYRFALRQEGQSLDEYGGRPDGSAVDSQGNLWASCFEGQRVVQISPEGKLLMEIPLPVRCPTMPCFGGPDLKTLYISTARQGRPAEELEAQPWAGCVLALKVDVPGLQANFARLP